MVGGVGGLQGTLAEFAQPMWTCWHRRLSFDHAARAVMPLVITAWKGLVDKAKIQQGQTVLIHAEPGVWAMRRSRCSSRGAKVYATVSQDKRELVEALGATAIDRYTSVNDYLTECAGGEGFDVIYDTLGGAVLDASFAAVKRYTGHVVSRLGWGTHSLAPLSFVAPAIPACLHFSLC